MSDKYTQKHKDLVLKIMEASETSAPVDVSFGYVSKTNQCQNGIVIRKAPSSVLKMLFDEGYCCHLEDDGAIHIWL